MENNAAITDRDSLFESIKRGLNEAIEYQQAILRDEQPTNVKIDKVTIFPVQTYTKEEIKQVRAKHKMTQRMFAEVVGVSQKTVEAWETGTNTPTGSAMRVIQLIESNENVLNVGYMHKFRVARTQVFRKRDKTVNIGIS